MVLRATDGPAFSITANAEGVTISEEEGAEVEGDAELSGSKRDLLAFFLGRRSVSQLLVAGDHGDPAYARIDAPASREQKRLLATLSADRIGADSLAGESIVATLTEAPGNGAPIGGLKVVTESAWFAARPSGTEDVYKIYAESFLGPDHLTAVQDAARELVASVV